MGRTGGMGGTGPGGAGGHTPPRATKPRRRVSDRTRSGWGPSASAKKLAVSPMQLVVGVLIVCSMRTWTLAQSRTDAALRVTVVDPSGAVIVGGEVPVTPNAPSGGNAAAAPVRN